jgi:glycosyltransferase involved in cell wall biosynthesis
VEEFGIAAVEAHASGRPVIALGHGGVRETVADGVTGTFFAESTPEALVAAVEGFDTRAVDVAQCLASAERFEIARFQAGLARAVEETLAADRQPRPASSRPVGLARTRRSRIRNEPTLR